MLPSSFIQFILPYPPPPAIPTCIYNPSIYIDLVNNFLLSFADECQDTTDTDSYGSDEMEVLEYDVASMTASEVFYSNDSSSGTDVN